MRLGPGVHGFRRVADVASPPTRPNLVVELQAVKPWTRVTGP